MNEWLRGRRVGAAWSLWGDGCSARRADRPGSSGCDLHGRGERVGSRPHDQRRGFSVVADTNPFFQAGINGRRRVTCHQPDNNMTVTPESIQARFEATQDNDRIFRTNDGPTSPLADASTVEACREAYSTAQVLAVKAVSVAMPSGKRRQEML